MTAAPGAPAAGTGQRTPRSAPAHGRTRTLRDDTVRIPVRTAAAAAVDLVVTDPARARDEAAGLLAGSDDPWTLATAHRALGLALKEQGQLAPGLVHLRHAVRIAARNGLAAEEGRARMSLAVLLADQGRTTTALDEIDRAGRLLAGADASRLLAQRGLLLQRVNRDDEALDCYRRALPALRRRGDASWIVRVLLHRGIIHAYRGARRYAEADLCRCARLAAEHGFDVQHAAARHNLAFASARHGDIPGALALFDQAWPLLAGLDRWRPVALMDRAEALAHAGLGAEARTVLVTVVGELSGLELGYDLAEARLMLARAALLDSDPETARAEAGRARRMFRRQRRHGWAELARHLEVGVRFSQDERSPALLKAARDSADRLAALSRPAASAESGLIAGRIALDLGRREEADSLLTRAAADRNRGPAGLRATAWYAEAIRRLGVHGDRRGCLRAASRALDVLEENAAALGATDLRAHAASHRAEPATLGTRLAVDAADPRAALAWAERWRAGVLRRPPARPPGDARLAADLSALRRVTARLHQTESEGGDTARLRAEQLRIELAVRDRCRHARGSHAPDGRLDLRVLGDALGDRALVELVRLGNGLHAVTMSEGRTRLFRLGAYDEAITELESMRFALHRIARRHGTAALQEAARTALEHARLRLDRLLLGGRLARTVGDRDLVIVPTGALHAVPWPVLPTCAGRPVTVAPSARTWLAAVSGRRPSRSGPGRDGAGPRREPVVLVAGPDLQHAEPEIAALARRYPHAVRLTGPAATADAVRHALDGADLAHLAVHGRFRADNPLFSCLDVADGPLTVYDLERLRHGPRRLILSACDAGLSAVRPGDELMGLASTVLALGTQTLIASATPVHDADTRSLMLDLHARLGAGVPPARALAEAQEATGVAGFICFGAG